MDLTARLHAIPVGKFHYKLLWVIGLGWMFDAMDTGLIAFILTKLGSEWGLSAADKGWIVSIGFVGMAIGAVLSGALADRLGRRNVFSLTLLVYSAATACSAFAPDLSSLLVLRFIVGLGLGGQLPVAVTLVSEYIPAHVRGRFIVLLESFWGLGWLLAALIAYFVIPSYGWQAAFLMGGIPILYAVVIYRKVPESIPYLINRGRVDEAHRILQSIEKQSAITVHQQIIVPVVKEVPKLRLKQLWSAEYARRSLMLWLIWFGIVYSYYGIFTWLPSLLVKAGYTIVQSFEYVLLMILAQLPGYLVAAWLVEKLGRKKTLAGFIAMCAVSAYFFGEATQVAQIMFWGCCLSFFNLGAWGVLYTYTPEQYPSHIRAFGSGWAAAIGRIGGIVAPLVVTQLMGFSNGFQLVFSMFTAVLCAIALIIMLLGTETKGQILQ
ncbi:MFS transporter [Acinetobacter larvae]|uniref:MFS transporter n=1 Tax=Acinetobacter larvae TaxID=1789224 RepID=A0A1B2M3B2_9GAMM|nr:MFS transporter [Acinetobacter larvae]AOA59690.1 MFS transporter [Acinetobacter larvae]